MCNNPLASNLFGKDINELERSKQLYDTLLASKPGDQVEMDADMWEKINQFVNFPTNPYQGNVALQLLPFFRAVRDAV